MKKQLLAFLGIICFSVSSVMAQQISIPRIDQMPDKPSPYVMRDWKKVTIDYDNLVFDTNKTGTYLPLSTINSGNGTNYSNVNNIRMSTFVGQSSTATGEAINIMPAIVGASLVGVDKRNHYATNWVEKVKDFFNLKNGQNVYLNNYSAGTGGDWWYEIMPNIYFYQLHSLYPNIDSDFTSQFSTVADRQLEVVQKLGGKIYPWQAPNMDYRAFNLLTGEPKAGGVHQPEAAGSIAWILYQAYKETNDIKYKQGAELALDFLQDWTSNPSYEIQLPYGIITAARLNAEDGTEYDLQKFINWAFSNSTGTLREWGCIVGNWNGYDMAGLIGEAKDGGDDYAFSMNGFQHAAALAPVAKYDKKYAKSLAKWILNLSNASRFFYANGLPEANQQAASLAWAKENDPNNCIPFESIKENWKGQKPFAMGDAFRNGWAPTDLSLYSGSSVGYLAAIVEKTNIEGILQIDLNKTDFRGENTYSNYLYFNPNSATENVNITLPAGNYDIYDAISETTLKTNVSGTASFSISANDIRLLVIYPAGSATEVDGRLLKVNGGGIIDYHYGYNYSSILRFKSFTSDKTSVVSGDAIQFNSLVENQTGAVTYQWYVNNTLVSGATNDNLSWTTPVTDGTYTIKCIATASSQSAVSNEIVVTVAPVGTVAPEINDITLSGAIPYNKSSVVDVTAATNATTSTIVWTCTGGTLSNETTLSPSWALPAQEGVYKITLNLNNPLGTASVTKQVLVKNMDDQSEDFDPIIYYSFDGNTQNLAQDAYHATSVNAISATDAEGRSNRAYKFSANDQYIYTANDAALNFGSQLAVSFWVKPDNLGGSEQFLVSHGSWEERYKLSINLEKNVRFTINTTERIVDIDDPTPLQDGVFSHYAGVYTGYSVELYRDGNLVSYQPLSGNINSSSKSLTIARKDENTSDYTFKGTIDEVRIYESSLNSDFIQKLPAIWNENVGGNVDIQELKVNGKVWDINNKYVVECGNTDTQLAISVSAYPNSVVDKPSINVDISKPSVQEVKFTITSDDGFSSQDYVLLVEKRFSFDALVSQKWNKVLTVNNNSETNGGYTFTAYKWFKNGKETGNTKQYYSVGNGANDLLDPNDEYSVQVTTTNGAVLSTCPAKPVLKATSIKVYPNPASVGETITFEADMDSEILANAKIYVYNMLGVLIDTVPVFGKTTMLNLSASGNYILRFVSPSGFEKEFKTIIK